ncbi:MAG: endonuclease/exonuclease/phosphatase family protein [Planctomycetes bacterium]|nr:endonuclease/exonuclease/phosphatase family protein [Planctomycetota bacterium]
MLGLLALVWFAVAFALGLGMSASWWAWAEPVSNLRSPLAIALLVTSLALWILFRRSTRGRWLAVLGVPLACWGAWPLLALVPGHRVPIDASIPPLRLGSVNLLFGIAHPEPVFEWMAEQDLDVVGFVELKDSPRSKLRWPRLLASWKATYPFQAVEPHEYYGLALISKVPLEDVRLHWGPGGNGEESERPLRMSARLEWHGQGLRVVVMHPPRPDGPWRLAMREECFDSLATELATEGSCVVMGDFNSNEGSPLFRKLKRRANLTDSRQGWGYGASWSPLGFPLPLVPLDHILVRGPVVLERGVGPPVRSDHRPIHAVLAWPSPPNSSPSPH